MKGASIRPYTPLPDGPGVDPTSTMNKTNYALLGALPLAALLSLALPREQVSFAPEEGSSLTKHFSTSGEVMLDDMQVLINGEENDMMPSMEMTMSWDQTIDVVDSYTSMDEGRPGVLSRTFEGIDQDVEVEASMEMMGQSEDQGTSGAGSSDLEGKTVVFTWSDDEAGYTPAFAEGSEGDEELLGGLTEDMDMRKLLPSGDVSEGDQWDLEPAALADVMAPGGDLRLDLEMDEMGGDPMGTGGNAEMISQMHEMFDENTEGTAIARYIGTRDVDGTPCRVIEVEFDLESSRDMTEKMEEMMAEQAPEGMEVDMELESFDLEFTFEGQGELLWNSASNHVHSMKLEGDVTVMLDMAMSIDMGEALQIEMTMDMSGEVSQKLTTE